MNVQPRPSQHSLTEDKISKVAPYGAAAPSHSGKKVTSRRHGASRRSAKGKNRSAVMSRLRALHRELMLDLAATEQGFRETGNVFSEGDEPGYRSTETPNLSTLRHLSMAIADVDAAIERVNDGSYGVCTGCGETIQHARLVANPIAIRCRACQEKHERSRK